MLNVKDITKIVKWAHVLTTNNNINKQLIFIWLDSGQFINLTGYIRRKEETSLESRYWHLGTVLKKLILCVVPEFFLKKQLEDPRGRTSTIACEHMICKYVDQKGSAAMLTSMQLAGVTPEVNLRITHVTKHARDAPWLWNPGLKSPEVQKGANNGPTKRPNRLFCMQLSVVNNSGSGSVFSEPYQRVTFKEAVTILDTVHSVALRSIVRTDTFEFMKTWTVTCHYSSTECKMHWPLRQAISKERNASSE